ncbi:DUF6338 family protein [Streptomyces sp. NPDC127119]|uniref:DUF6338 family protein n=1 Tax=Streptomyces sp. NPDC127119 TaxID=3345370 RepID=UPI00363DB4A4
MPTSFTAVAVFFVFVVPGIAFELSLRERIPARAESPFVETARVLLVGALATFVACGLLLAIHSARPGSLPSPDGLLAGTIDYTRTHLRLTIFGLVAELVAATALALLVAGMVRPPTSSGIRGADAWYELLYNEVPEGRQPKLVVALKSGGHRVEGFLHSLNAHPEVDRRELVLRSVEFLQEDPASVPASWPPPFVRLAIPAREIAWLAVAHAVVPGTATPATGTSGTPPASGAPPTPPPRSLVDTLRGVQWQLSAGLLAAETAVLLVLG